MLDNSVAWRQRRNRRATFPRGGVKKTDSSRHRTRAAAALASAPGLEFSRPQIWQWMRSDKGRLDDGRKITEELFRRLLAEELPKVKTYLGEAGFQAGKFEEGAKLFNRITTDDVYVVEFLTLPAHAMID